MKYRRKPPRNDGHLLAIDVGNTHITVGLFRQKQLKHTWRLNTHRYYTSDELGIHFLNLLATKNLDASLLDGVSIASVVPSLDQPLLAMSRTYLRQNALMVGPQTSIGIKNLYKNPDEVGADRLVDAAAVHAFYGKAAIVVDFGTATTLDCVSAKGEYLGGAICPGMELAGEWLATHTAKLPRVAFQKAPERVMGKTTKESLQSGLFYGYIALVEGLLDRLAKEMRARPLVVVTGGLSVLIGPHIKAVSHIAPDLTLEGLRLIWEQNKNK
jgi:type III pantothenate kinase